MVCSHCQGAEDVFSQKYARKDLNTYREKGASQSTQLMLTTLKRLGVVDKTLLDIGGGVGAVAHELLAEGLAHALDVDASSAYINVATEEAQRRGHLDRITFQHGDFVQLAPQIDMTDIVTLDRVVCCYPDFEALIDLSSQRAREVYALVYPRDHLLSKSLIPVFNFFAFRIWGNPFRTYIHDSQAIDAIIRNNGLECLARHTTSLWQVLVYRRASQ
ncbi:MAG: class I SAM-dependent methyltransferase [Anaerolineae bacterium]